MLPFVSLIIPTLNEEKYLEQTITSLLSNDYPDSKLEILIIDGLSKDNTLAIAQEFANKFTNIRLIFAELLCFEVHASNLFYLTFFLDYRCSSLKMLKKSNKRVFRVV